MCHRLVQVVLSLLIVVFAAPTEAGSLVFWGDDSTGMAAVPAGSFKQVAISDCGSGNVHQEFGIAIRDDGTLVGWGNDSSGQTNVPSGTFIDVAAGVTCAYGVRTDGTVVGWGVNGYGGPVYMPPSNYTYKAVSCASSNFEYFLTTDGEAIGVGYGVNGVTYTGPFTAIAATDWASVGLTTSGTLVNLSSIGPTFVPPSGEFSAIAPEPYEDLAMRDDGTLVLWNASGEASGPSGTYIGIAAGLSHIVAIRSDGTLVAWGDDTYGQTNVPAGQYCYVAAGGNVSVAITVPEPSTFALLGVGAVSLFACGWWQRTKRMLATVRCRGLFWGCHRNRSRFGYIGSCR